MAGLVFALIFAWLVMGRSKPKSIEIYHTFRPAGYAMRARRDVPPTLSFGLGDRFKLTEIKVVSLAAWQTNHGVPPVWHLVSDSNSVPIKDLLYGMPIRGMRPSVKGATPDPLEPGVKYRLLIEAGSRKAEHDFEPVAN